MILCDNECPFDDCDRKYRGELPPGVSEDDVSIVDLTCICERYTKHIAEQINNAAYRLIEM